MCYDNEIDLITFTFMHLAADLIRPEILLKGFCLYTHFIKLMNYYIKWVVRCLQPEFRKCWDIF